MVDNDTFEMADAATDQNYATPKLEKIEDHGFPKLGKIFKTFTWRMFINGFVLVSSILLVFNLTSALYSLITTQNDTTGTTENDTKQNDNLITMKAVFPQSTTPFENNTITEDNTTSSVDYPQTTSFENTPTTEDTTSTSAPEQCCNAERISVNLTTRTVSGNLDAFGARITVPFTAGSECDSRGVIQVRFEDPPPCKPLCNYRTLRVDMKPHKTLRDNFLFNIGDSPSNNGNGGDSAHNSWDAEIQGRHSGISIWSNDYCTFPNPYQNFPNAASAGVIQFTVKVDDGYIRVLNNDGIDKVYNDTRCLFGLNGQYDNEKRGTNDFNVYVAFNRAVYGSRIGRGLCSAELSWECCDQERN